MKKAAFILFVLVFISLSFISCQKAEEPEGKKEVLAEKEEIIQQPLEAKQELKPEPDALSAANPEVQYKENENTTAQIEVKEEPQGQPKQQPFIPETGEEKKEKPEEAKVSLLTEEEQEFVTEVTQRSILATPNAFESSAQATKLLQILLKGDHRTVRFLHGVKGVDDISPEEMKIILYGEVMESAMHRIILNQEGYGLLREVLKTKAEYPAAMARAAQMVKFAGDESVIPLLKEVAKHPDPWVRLEAAGSLLSLGDADTALPILDELTEKKGYIQSMYYMFKKPGEIKDERGYGIVEKALNNPKAEVRISAVKLLLEAKKIKKEKAEEMALGMLKKFMYAVNKDYGFKVTGGASDPAWVVLPEFQGKKLEELETLFNSDARACRYAMQILGKLKSSKAIPLLTHIKENNQDGKYVCWENRADTPAENALENITKNRGGK